MYIFKKKQNDKIMNFSEIIDFSKTKQAVKNQDQIGIECNRKKEFCVLQKKVLSFGPNRTVEVRPNKQFG